MDLNNPSAILRELNHTVPCYAATIFSENSIWHGTNPLNQVIPIFIVQLAVAILWVHLLLLILKPLQQPRFVIEIIAGILLGPIGLGRFETLSNKFFPSLGFVVLDPMAHFALVYYAFLLGLEIDLSTIWQTGKKSLAVAVAGIICPFTLGSCLYLPFRRDSKTQMGFMFWGIALTVTGCSVLGQLLDKRKILHTEMAKIAMSAALVNDLCAWALLAIAIALSGSLSTVHWALFSTMAFVFLSIHCIRPALLWIVRRKPEGQAYSDYYISAVLVGAGLCGVLTDAFGTHPVVGAFVFGLVMPSGELEALIVDRLEEFVCGFFMPIFFTVCGLRTDVDGITSNTSFAMVALIVIGACAAKVVSSSLASFFCNMELKDSASLGLLMNTKSLLAVIILYLGLEQKALSIQTYTIMMIAILVMTTIVGPIMNLNRPERNFSPYKRRTIQKAKAQDEFRVLACVHGMRNVPSVINLLEVSHASGESPITVFAVHLVELIGRASAMVTVQSMRISGLRNPGQSQAQMDQIITAFQQYERRSDCVTVQPLIARSAYTTMDEDICGIAEEKRAAFVLLPFHRQQTLDGDMEDINPAIRDVNENVLANAPCSVGIIIDRGLSESGDFARRIAMLYFGGPDDREALSYALRMAHHPDVSLTVVRFVPGSDALDLEPTDFPSQTNGAVALNIDMEREKQRDEDFLTKFNIRVQNDASIKYTEIVLNDEEETVTAIKGMDSEHYDLYIVGRGRGMVSPLTAGLLDWCDCPELGAIGDILVTSEFSSAFSVLVVQQYSRSAIRGDVAPSDRTTSSSISRGLEQMECSQSQVAGVEADAGFESLSEHRKINSRDEY